MNRLDAIATAWGLLLLALFAALHIPAAHGETATGTGAHDNWTVSLPAQPVGTVYLILSTQDADGPAEGALHIGTQYSAALWGALGSPANDYVTCRQCWRELAYAIPASAWGAGANVVAFTWNQPGAVLHDVRSVTVLWDRGPDTAWLAYARALQAAGVVPDWAEAGDEFWFRQREDTDPPRTYACARDLATGAVAARWTTADVLAGQVLPFAAAPPATTDCDVQWCVAEGPGRAAAIRAACP